MYTRPFLSRCLAVLLMSVPLSGCTGWHVEDLSPAAVVEGQQPHEVRVQLADGRREYLYDPEVRGDSLLGRRNPSAKQPDRALMLSDVKEVATGRFSGGRTAALVSGVAIVGVIVAIQTFHMGRIGFPVAE